MTRSENANKNLDLAFEVIRQVVAEPKLIGEVNKLAAEGTLVLYDPTDDRLSAANDRIVAKMDQRNDRTVRVELTRRLHLTPR